MEITKFWLHPLAIWLWLDFTVYIYEIRELDQITLKFIPALIFYCPMISKYEIPGQKSLHLFATEKRAMCFAKVPLTFLSQLSWALRRNATRELGAGRKEKSETSWNNWRIFLTIWWSINIIWSPAPSQAIVMIMAWEIQIHGRQEPWHLWSSQLEKTGHTHTLQATPLPHHLSWVFGMCQACGGRLHVHIASCST